MKTHLKNSLWGVVILLIALAWIFGLFIDVTGDSGLYAAITRQMTESGDWLNLKINGEPYDQKPHFLFWLSGLGLELFGNTNFAFKLFPFLFSISSLWFVYKLTRLEFQREAAFVAVLFLGTSQMFFLYLLDFHTDTVLQAAVTLSLWQLAAHLKNRKKLPFILGFVAIGLAMLTKGPVGVVLPFFMVLIYLLIKKDYHQLFHPKWLLGVIISLVVISPTLFHLYDSFGWEGIRFFFITNNIGRVTGKYVATSTDPFFYLYNMLWAFLPWTAIILISIFKEVRSWFKPPAANALSAALLGGSIVLLAVFSIAKGKAPNYFLILLPSLSVVAACRSLSFKKTDGKISRFILCSQGIVLTLLFLLFIAVMFYFSEQPGWLPLLLLALLFISAVLFIKAEKDSWKRLLFFPVLITGIFNVYLNAEFIPELFSYQGARRALEVYEENRKPGEPLYNLHHEEYELFFYAKDPVIQVHTSDDYKRMVKKNNIWIYTTEAGYKGILNNVEKADTLFLIRYRNMNELILGFLNRKKRRENLKTNYLLKLK